MNIIRKLFAFRNKKVKLFFYLRRFWDFLPPLRSKDERIDRLKSTVSEQDWKEVTERVSYYNKLADSQPLSDKAIRINQYKKKGRISAYFYDFRKVLRYYDRSLKVVPLFGDITHVPDEPTLQKSRPVGDDNDNAVILKFNEVRHFNFIRDVVKYEDKKDQLVGRGSVFPRQQVRVKLLEKYFGHPMCNIGKVNRGRVDDKWLVDKMSIEEQLDYKFILAWEGNDVATNLKWIMSSNSIAVMPRPRYETWFMEGRLLPDYHYIALNDDLSDLEEKLQFYIDNPQEALQIIENAHVFVRQFMDKRKEEVISMLVMDKYFEHTGQEARER